MARKRLVDFYKDEKRNYEVCLLLNNKLSESELKLNLDNLSKIITELKQKVIAVNNTKVKDFAYPIGKSKEKTGYFACLYIQSEPKLIQTILDKLKVQDNVLRVKIILGNPKKQFYGIFTNNYEENYKNNSSFFSYDDPNFLLNFLGERGMIIKTKKNHRKQRQIAKTIKFSRIVSILPFVEE